MLSKLYFAITLAFACTGATASALSGQTSPELTVLTALRLATDYNKAMKPPPAEVGGPVTVLVFAYLGGLVKVDSTAQEVTIQLWISKTWNDSRLAWTGRFNSTLDNVTHIHVPKSWLWLPDIDMIKVREQKETSLEASPLRVSNAGTVFQTIEMVATFKCHMRIAKFPFDVQRCIVSVSSRTYMNTDQALLVDAIPGVMNITVAEYVEHSSEFCILDAEFKKAPQVGKDKIDLAVTFQRRPTFYVVNLILPSILLLAISALAFRMPPECGERISFSITIVLSMCVFLQLSGNYTPTQSDSVPLMTWYFAVSMLMAMVNVLCNAFVLNCHFKAQRGGDRARVTNRLIRALFLNPLVSKGSHSPQQVTPIDAQEVDAADPKSQPQSSREALSYHGNEWDAVVVAADGIFFAIYIGVTVCTALSLLILQMSSMRYDCKGLKI